MCRRINKSRRKDQRKSWTEFETVNLEFNIEDHRISSVAVECVDTRRNTKGEGNDLGIN